MMSLFVCFVCFSQEGDEIVWTGQGWVVGDDTRSFRTHRDY